MRKKIVLIGPYCATGGVSIHIKRLEKLLISNFNVSIIDESRLKDNDGTTFNIRKKQFFKYVNIIAKNDIVHIHSSLNVLRIFHIFVALLFGKKIILTVHSLRKKRNDTSFWLLKFILIFVNKIIVVSKEIDRRLKIKNTFVLPAFLPVKLEDEPELPKEVLTLLDTIANKNLIVSNAYRLNFHNGEDLYGLDMLIEVAAKLKEVNKTIFIVFVITTLEVNKKVFDEYLHRIEKENLASHIKIITYPISFVKLIEKSDLVVRATNTDGDALTVREALYLNKNVIASDVVERPRGAILFKTRDNEDLYKKILFALKRKSQNNFFIDDCNYLKIYGNIYRSIR